jgi:hypothetical protein
MRASEINWLQLLLGGSMGALLTFLLARGLDLVRNRPRLEVRLQDTRERLYVRNKGAKGQVRLVVSEPDDPEAMLVITLDLACVNRSYQPDGLVAAKLSAPNIGWTTPVRGRIRADEAFTGLNVEAHSVRPVRLRFFLNRMSHGSEPGFGSLPLWSEDPLPEPAAGRGDGAATRSSPAVAPLPLHVRSDCSRSVDTSYTPRRRWHARDPLPDKPPPPQQPATQVTTWRRLRNSAAERLEAILERSRKP